MNRPEMIQALRDLAGFLEENQEVPAPAYAMLYATISVGDDADGFAAVETAACVMGTELTRHDGFAITRRYFGPLMYDVGYSSTPGFKDNMKYWVEQGNARSGMQTGQPDC